ncbi:MAG: hypothetical protein NTZ04_01410 [Chloroflexi bacterium]|nr:hypothetical protein [Chloroflexota bacterium]
MMGVAYENQEQSQGCGCGFDPVTRAYNYATRYSFAIDVTRFAGTTLQIGSLLRRDYTERHFAKVGYCESDQRKLGVVG